MNTFISTPSLTGMVEIYFGLNHSYPAGKTDGYHVKSTWIQLVETQATDMPSVYDRMTINEGKQVQ